MKTIWKAGLSVEQKRLMEGEFASSALLRDRLSQIINKKIDEGRASARSASTYENPNWGFVQADHIGFERAMYEILSLLK